MNAQDRILQAFSKNLENNGVTATLVDATSIGNGLMRVVARFNKAGSKYNYRTALSTLLDNKGTPVENSFRVVSNENGITTAVGIISSNPTVVPYDPQAHASYKVITANCLMDSEDALWDVADTSAGKMLVRQAEEDFSSLVSASVVRVVGAPALASIASVHADLQEFVTYVNPTTHTLEHGFVIEAGVDDIVVIPVENEDEEVVIPSEDLIVESRFVKADAFKEIVASPEKLNKQRLKEYYEKVYNYSPEYLQQFLDVIDNNSAL